MTSQTDVQKAPSNINANTVVSFLLASFFIVFLSFLLASVHGFVGWILVAVTLVILCFVLRYTKLTRADVGLSRRSIRSGIIVGLAFALICAVGMTVAYVFMPSLFSDQRYEKTTQEIVWLLFVHIPLHTVLLEEFLFRGFIYGYAKNKKGHFFASIYSSLLFGLWHIGSSADLFNSSDTVQNTLGSQASSGVLVGAGIVAATTAAGMVFCYVRNKSGSLVAPMLLHWGINATAAYLAYLATRS